MSLEPTARKRFCKLLVVVIIRILGYAMKYTTIVRYPATHTVFFLSCLAQSYRIFMVLYALIGLLRWAINPNSSHFLLAHTARSRIYTWLIRRPKLRVFIRCLFIIRIEMRTSNSEKKNLREKMKSRTFDIEFNQIECPSVHHFMP